MCVRLYIKFGARERLEQMQREGLFYCNTITYFSKIEDNHRGDSLESVTKLQYLENTIIQFRPANDPSVEWKKLNSTNMQIKNYYDEPFGSLFCMPAFKINPVKDISEFNIDERFFGFGFGLMILRQDLFMERLRKALTELPFKTCMRTINYLDLHKY